MGWLMESAHAYAPVAGDLAIGTFKQSAAGMSMQMRNRLMLDTEPWYGSMIDAVYIATARMAARCGRVGTAARSRRLTQA